MARKTIEELRAAFKKDETANSRPNNYYPFWNMKEGESVIVRFLPDLDDDNPLSFMVEKLMHTLDINGERKNIPCLKMYGEDCPICKVSAGYYKEGDKNNGKKYWRKKQHILQALIIEDPLPADSDTGESHEGKVRYLTLGYQIYNIIKAAFESGDLDEIPYSYEGGCNFIIKKSKQGDYASYSVGTNFARKTSDLDEDQIAIATDNMVDLKTLLPANPGIEKVEGMLEAAMTGKEWSDDSDEESSAGLKFKKKAANVSDDSEDDDSEVEVKRPTSKSNKATAEPAGAGDTSAQANDILAQIRSRKKAV